MPLNPPVPTHRSLALSLSLRLPPKSAQPGAYRPYNYNANIYAESGKGQTTEQVGGKENNRAEDPEPDLPELRQLLLPASIRLGPPGRLDIVRSEPP